LSCLLGQRCLVLPFLMVITSGHVLDTAVSLAGNDKIPFFSLLLLPPSIIFPKWSIWLRGNKRTCGHPGHAPGCLPHLELPRVPSPAFSPHPRPAPKARGRARVVALPSVQPCTSSCARRFSSWRIFSWF